MDYLDRVDRVNQRPRGPNGPEQGHVCVPNPLAASIKSITSINVHKLPTHKEKRDFSLSTEIPCSLMAGPMGLEPTASGVTGR